MASSSPSSRMVTTSPPPAELDTGGAPQLGSHFCTVNSSFRGPCVHLPSSGESARATAPPSDATTTSAAASRMQTPLGPPRYDDLEGPPPPTSPGGQRLPLARTERG